ncbi:MAG: ABC transporter permease [Pseudomonadota bacterium]
MKQTLRDAWYLLRQNPVTLLSGAGVLLLLVLAVFGPWLTPYDPLKTDAYASLQAPSMAHWFGTDQLGRDILSRVIAATRLDIAISVSAVLMSAVVGVLIGAVAGYTGGWFDRIIGRGTDVLMAFPLFVLAMGLVAALGNSVQNVVLATAIVNVPFYLRLMRAEVNVRRDAGFIEAARISGNGHASLLFRQLIPNCMPPITIQMSLNLGWAILNAAGLSYIGLGVQAPTPEWGIMVADGASSMMSGEWWVVVYPGLALMFSVFCFNLLGDGLRDMLDPKRRT